MSLTCLRSFLVRSATSGGKDDAFNFLSSGIGPEIFKIVLQVYIGTLFLVVIASLGNRPQGSKWTYSICIVLFGICNIITLWCAGYTVYLAVPHTVAGWKDFPQ